MFVCLLTFLCVCLCVCVFRFVKLVVNFHFYHLQKTCLTTFRYHSSSSSLGSTTNSEPTNCYNALIKYLAHLGRRAKRKCWRAYKQYRRKQRRLKRAQQQQQIEQGKSGDDLPVVRHKTQEVHKSPLSSSEDSDENDLQTKKPIKVSTTQIVSSTSGSPAAITTTAITISTNTSAKNLLPPPNIGSVVKQLSFHNMAEVWDSNAGPPPPPPPSPQPLHSSASPSVSLSNGVVSTNGLFKPVAVVDPMPAVVVPPMALLHPEVHQGETLSDCRRGSAPGLLCQQNNHRQSSGLHLATVGSTLQPSSPVAGPIITSASCSNLPTEEDSTDHMKSSRMRPNGLPLTTVLESSHLVTGASRTLISSGQYSDQIGSPRHDWSHTQQRLRPGDDEEDDDDDELDEYVQCLIDSQLWRCIRAFRRCMRAVVDHRYFQRLILLAILFNTLSMGIEYHDQPEQLTQAVEYSNLFFTAIFACEMLLKLLAHGCYEYINDGFNVFDGIVVIVR